MDEHVPRVAQNDGLVAAKPESPTDRDRGLERAGSYATSRSFWLSASARNFFRPWFSICRIRSRVT
jgi:hypothetical protein